MLYEPRHEKTCLMPHENNKGKDQPAQMRSLISTIIVHCESYLVANPKDRFSRDVAYLFVRIITNEPAHEIMVFITYATSKGSGKPAHPRSLAKAFAVRTHEVWM